MNTELEFDIENFEIRPEFEVLKAYFSKSLKIKNIQVAIYAEFENGKLISQLATSTSLNRITNEIIEGVKFKFIENNFLGKVNRGDKSNILDVNQLQSDSKSNLYDSGDELLNDFLKNKNYKHQKHLLYLADRHARTILKIRFVLSPFSFVFLIEGAAGFHIIVETLNTEEATYIFSFNNDKKELPEILKQVDLYFNIIKNKGRKGFLENPPMNFSRILHDYSDERKGFVVWKDLLEERIF